jgi:hypothetical protein
MMDDWESCLKLDHDFIDEAPAPALTGLNAAHDGVAGGLEMFGGVFADGGVAAADVAADEAFAQVNPVHALGEAFYAAFA